MSEAPAAPIAEPAAPPPADPNAAPAPEPAPQPAPEPEKPKTQPWFQTRINQITAEKHEERRQREAAEARANDLAAKLAASGQPNNPAPSLDLDKIVNERALQLKRQEDEQRRQADFNASCNRVYEQGKKDIPDFDNAVQSLRLMNDMPTYPALLEASAAVQDGHKVLHALGNDLNEAQRILSLPPVQMAIEVTMLAGKLRAKPVSQAPAPVNPLKGGDTGSAPGPDDEGKFKSQADYRVWREKNMRKHG